MNITKQQWAIIGVVAVIAVWYLFLRKKDSKDSKAIAFIPGKDKAESGYAESRWTPEYRDVNLDKAALSGISLSNISTFGTPLV